MTRELRTDRAKLIADMQQLNAKAETENRNLTPEEKVNFERMASDAGQLKERYEREESLDTLNKELSQTAGSIVDPLKARSVIVDPKDRMNTVEYRSACDHYLRTGDQSHLRAMDVGTPADGGYTLPTDAASKIVLALNRGAVVRRAGASVLQTSRNTVIPVSAVVSGGWVNEGTGTSDATPVLGAFSANAFKYVASVPVSNELLADSVVDIQAFLTERFLDAWSQASDNAYLTGSGPSTQPTGLLSTATTKVVVSEETFTPEELIAHFYSVPAQYRSDPSCAWVMNDSTLGFIAGMAIDVTKKIPFTPGVNPGDPDKLFYKPVYSSAAMATTFDANAKLAVVGAFKYYQIVDRIAQAGIKRLNEIGALSDQTYFIGSWRTDGKCMLANAFRTLTLAAS